MEIEKVSSIKQVDKIFNARRGDKVVEIQDTTFKIHPRYITDNHSISGIDEIDFKDISKIIEQELTPWKDKLKDVNYTFKKNEINEIYRLIRPKTKRYKITDVISVLCEYLNINVEKLYNFLGNAYKNEIINELDKLTKVLSKKKIIKLF